jgi:hypothetical protein
VVIDGHARCRVSGGDSSSTFNGARLRRGIVNPQALVGCSGDGEAAARTNNRQRRSDQITVSERQSMLRHCCWVLLASACVFRSATNAMLCSVTSILLRGVPD